VIGIHASRSGNRFEALEPIRQGVLRHFGTIGAKAADGLNVRHDHGSNYMSQDFREELTFLGIVSSPSFVREPEGNGVAERFIRTLKENLLWVKTFETIEELRIALQDKPLRNSGLPSRTSPAATTRPARRQAPISNPRRGQGNATQGWSTPIRRITLGSLNKHSRVSHIRGQSVSTQVQHGWVTGEEWQKSAIDLVAEAVTKRQLT